jgi:hypothetical protein
MHQIRHATAAGWKPSGYSKSSKPSRRGLFSLLSAGFKLFRSQLLLAAGGSVSKSFA